MAYKETRKDTFYALSRQPSSDASGTLPYSNDRLGSCVDIKMLVDTLQMLLNGAWTDLERERDFLVRHSLLKPGQDFGFPL